MQHILMKKVLGGKYSKWIVILQEFDLEFEKAKSKKSLVFAKLICLLPSPDTKNVAEDHTLDETLFLIDTSVCGMGISFGTSKHINFHPTLRALIVDASDIRPDNTLLSKTHFIVGGLIPSYDDVLHLRKLNES